MSDKLKMNSEEGAVNNEANRSCLSNMKTMPDGVRRMRLKRNRGMLAQPINQVGHEVLEMRTRFPVPPDPPKVVRSLIPRSVLYEIDYQKTQYNKKVQEALRKLQEQWRKKDGDSVESVDVEDKEPNQDLKDNTGVCTNMGAGGKLHPPKYYCGCSSHQNIIPERTENFEPLITNYPLDYLGQKGRKPKERPPMPKNYVLGQTDYRGECHPDPLLKPYDPANRVQEFIRVGQPFKTRSVRWVEQQGFPLFLPDQEREELSKYLRKTGYLT